jgi:hypothetical protein
MSLFIQYVQLNYLLVISFMILIVSLSVVCGGGGGDDNTIGKLITGCISFLFITFAGYYMHVISHQYNYTSIYYSLYQSSNYWGQLFRILPKCIHSFFKKQLWLADFHDIIHHDSSINHTYLNLFIEFCMNLYVEGICWIVLFQYLMGCQWFNYSIFWAWSFIYATTHIINFNIQPSRHHQKHHLHKYYNYSFGFIDILLGTNYDNELEQMNHVSINVICVMLFILFCHVFFETMYF